MRAFAMRRPRLTLVMICLFLACLIAINSGPLIYGTYYLGRDWVIAALAGMVTAAGLIAAAVVSRRRHGLRDELILAWLALWLVSASALRLPFSQHPHGGVQPFLNAVHAALLGYGTASFAAIFAWFAVQFLRLLRTRVRSLPAPAGRAPPHAEIPGRLRFTEPEAATWRAGRLIAADGKVTWRSLKGDVTVDLTAACQAALPSAADSRQPRTTMLTTASGLAEVDVSPRALAALTAALPGKRRASIR
jgi:prepilin signal peptidase PulO-like enzyme (type II secretory pathway)